MIGWEDKRDTLSRLYCLTVRPSAVTFPGFFQPIQRILIRDPPNSISLSDEHTDEPLETELRIKDNIQ